MNIMSLLLNGKKILKSKSKFNILPFNDIILGQNRVISYISGETYKIHEKNFKNTESKNQWLSVVERIHTGTNTKLVNTIYPIYYSYIKNIAQKNNLELIVFDWWGKKINNLLDNIKGTEWILDSLMEEAKEKNQWDLRSISKVGQHHNSKSSHKMAVIINEKINEYKKLQ